MKLKNEIEIVVDAIMCPFCHNKSDTFYLVCNDSTGLSYYQCDKCNRAHKYYNELI